MSVVADLNPKPLERFCASGVEAMPDVGAVAAVAAAEFGLMSLLSGEVLKKLVRSDHGALAHFRMMALDVASSKSVDVVYQRVIGTGLGTNYHPVVSQIIGSHISDCMDLN